ncbi:MAG: MGH1-like glycoside hydrolase domain-containing protein [Gemmatimonadales bacterium]
MPTAESVRLDRDAQRTENWKRWGPYLSERQWGTVREDYSANGNVWSYFPHDHARSRVYRWGEDGLLGITDRQCRLCFSLALWNGRDPILKERLFGLTGPEGNHGEDVKENYYYLDSTPTHSYLKALYKYPQGAFPYDELVRENARRGKEAPEYELADTGAFDGDRYFDVVAEYAKASPEDILIRLTVANRGPEDARLDLLPTLWFRNTWSWGREGEGYSERPTIERASATAVHASHPSFGEYRLDIEPAEGTAPELLFTENETNVARLYGAPNPTPYMKDAFHRRVVEGVVDAVNPVEHGTKAAAWYRLMVPARSSVAVRLRLRRVEGKLTAPFGTAFDRTFAERIREADEFYSDNLPPQATDEERNVLRQGYAGLLWSKQFYHYVVRDWLRGDPSQPAPPAGRLEGRNAEWTHVFNRDVISMPDKWEYPWFAAWDLAFHMLPFARIDPYFAKDQLILFLREWYMHPNGQIPAYEFAFTDVNPPVHAWAVWRVYKMTGARGTRDRLFLERAFQKLLLNFTWWVNRKDPEGRNLFAGGFLGLDNIGVFDRSRPLPTGGHLEQADGTAWMAFYCNTMLSMALELASEDPAYEDIASKFFEHFIGIADAINTLGGSGLWSEDDGFYYDQLHVDGRHIPLSVRSLVGVIPLIAVEVLDERKIEKLAGFRRRMQWFLDNRPDLARHIACMLPRMGEEGVHRLLSIPSRARLERVLRYLLDESEFLSPHGIRSVSRVHAERPYVFAAGGATYSVDYVPGESNTGLFGGNSNWRGPVWFPINYLVLEALERYHHFYGDDLAVECPVGSGRRMNLRQVAQELARRLGSLFLPDAAGRRPCHGDDTRYAMDPHWKELVLFHEYFHGETGRGVGASHQTGWTALVLRSIEDTARMRPAGASSMSEPAPAPALSGS